MLDYHEYECPDCRKKTTHHVFEDETKGDTVTAWCEHCEEDKEEMVIKDWVGKQ